MGKKSEKEAAVAEILSGFNTLCDRGYALAVHIRYTRPTILYQTYSTEWADHYSEKGYMLSDPVVLWGLTNTGWVEWASLQGNDQVGVIADAVAHGLLNGWTYSVGPAASRTIAGLTRSVPFTAAERAEMAALVDKLHAVTEGFETFPPEVQDRLRSL